MALATKDITLVYGPNTVEFWFYDDIGQVMSIGTNTVFTIKRMDDTNGAGVVFTLATTSSSDNGYAVFDVNLSSKILKSAGDSTLDYKNASYDHIYSVKDSEQTYIYGRVNLLEIA